MGSPFLLQEIFLTQGLNLSFPHCRQTLYQLSHQGTEREIDCTINGLHLKHPKTSPNPSLSKTCLPKKLLRSRKEFQVYSAVRGCWLREMLKQGCPKTPVCPKTPLCGVLNRPPIALVMMGEICFIFFFKYPCGINLKLSNSLIVFLIKSFLSY